MWRTIPFSRRSGKSFPPSPISETAITRSTIACRTAAPYIVYTDASGICRRAEGEEYSMSLYGLAEYAVNEDPDTLTEEEKRFLTENILEKAR